MKRTVVIMYALIISLGIVYILVIKDSITKINLAINGKTLPVPYPSYAKNDYDPPKYVLPQKVVESDGQLPQEVIESFKNTITIRTKFIRNDPDGLNKLAFPSFYSMVEPIESGGTGFMIAPGIFITARHIFLIVANQLSIGGLPFEINKDGLPNSKHYHYSFYGMADINKKGTDFPLELIGIGELDKFIDLMALKSALTPPALKPLELEDNVILDETVYGAGRIPIMVTRDQSGLIRQEMLMDFISYNFQGTIKAILTDMPANSIGPIRIYRIKMNLESGFSGGPIFNRHGKVIALTMSRNSNFVYALSAQDIRLFIKSIPSKDVIK